MKRIYTLFLLAILLSACASATQPANTETSAQPTSLATTISKTPEVIVERSGGLAGVTDRWSIYADGRIVSDKGKEITTSPAAVSNFLYEIQSLGFFDLPESPKSMSTCNDCFTYKITVNKGDQSKTITALDGDSNTPEKVVQILQRVNVLVFGVQPR